MKSKLYYESHVTIEPVFDERLEKLKELVQPFGFRVADLLMKKREQDLPERSKTDTFCTARSNDWQTIESNTLNVVDILKNYGYQVWRYKIEDTLLDVRLK